MKKFEIPHISPTTNKTIRFPDDLVQAVEDAIAGTGCTFSRFVIEALRSALASLHEEEHCD